MEDLLPWVKGQEKQRCNYKTIVINLSRKYRYEIQERWNKKKNRKFSLSIRRSLDSYLTNDHQLLISEAHPDNRKL